MDLFYSLCNYYYVLCVGTVVMLKTEMRDRGVFCLRHRDPVKMERARSVIGTPALLSSRGSAREKVCRRSITYSHRCWESKVPQLFFRAKRWMDQRLLLSEGPRRTTNEALVVFLLFAADFRRAIINRDFKNRVVPPSPRRQIRNTLRPVTPIQIV